jgi:hypothetical protein
MKNKIKPAYRIDRGFRSALRVELMNTKRKSVTLRRELLHRVDLLLAEAKQLCKGCPQTAGAICDAQILLDDAIEYSDRKR